MAKVFTRVTALSILALAFLRQAPLQGQDQLPLPTGNFGIGLKVMMWTDPSRIETQSGKNNEKRKLLVYLFYPTDADAAGVPVAYYPQLKEIELFEEQFGKNFFRQNQGRSYKAISSLHSHAKKDSHLATGKERFPVLLFSHGGGIPVLFYTAIIENLVSHGYVVAGIEHSFDGGTIAFPDGSIISQTGWDQDAGRSPQERAAFHAARYDAGALDNRFVLNQLERVEQGELKEGHEFLAGRLDLKKAGALGHSLGGMISITAGKIDPRLRLCLNLDGGLDPGRTYGAVRQTVVAMYGDNRKPRKAGESDESFARRTSSRDRYVQRLKAPLAGAPKESYLLLVDSPAFSHFSYFDFPNAQAESPPWNATPEQWIDNQRIICDACVALFHAHLKLQSPAPVEEFLKRNPEVKKEPVHTP